MSFKMNEIGGKLFSPEWFDFDREGNMPKNETSVPDDWQPFIPDDEPLIECPRCEGTNLRKRVEYAADNGRRKVEYFCKDCRVKFNAEDTQY